MRLMFVALTFAGCVGGQSAETREASRVANPPPAPVSVAPPERDWTKAATGHGAVGVVPSAILEHMQRESAPGGNLTIGKPDGH